MSDLVVFLSQHQKSRGVEPEILEMLGKQASALYLKEGVPLNDGIRKLAVDHPDLTSEHLRRVVEHANVATYLGIHERNKTAEASASYPQFPLADAAQVVQALSKQASPILEVNVSPDYGRPPDRPPPDIEPALREIFGALPEESQGTGNTAIRELMDSKYLLTGLKENLEHAGETLDLSRKQAAVEYADVVKRHLLDGGSFSDVAAAANSIGVSGQKVAQVLHPVVVSLLREKVASPEDLQAAMRGLEKIAHRVVNPEHPLCRLFGAICGLDTEIEKTALALEDTDSALYEIDDFLRTLQKQAGIVGTGFKALNYATMAKKTVDTAKKNVGAFRQAADPSAPHTPVPPGA